AAFGGVIGRTVESCPGTEDRGDIDDLAAAALAELRQRGAYCKEGTLEIEVELLVPDRFCCLLDWHGAENAGIVDEDVESAEGIDHLLHHPFDFGDLRAVGAKRLGSAPRFGDVIDNDLRLVVAFGVVDGYLGALLPEAVRGSRPDALRRL